MSDQNHDIQIVVNERPVTVLGPRITGLAIKEAAIAQGVPIHLDFVLTLELNDRQSRPVPDDEVVTVHPGSRFLAIGPDDNS